MRKQFFYYSGRIIEIENHYKHIEKTSTYWQRLNEVIVPDTESYSKPRFNQVCDKGRKQLPNHQFYEQKKELFNWRREKQRL